MSLPVSINHHSVVASPIPLRSILDERPALPSIAGRIRPGIKVLTKAAVESKPEARAIYSAGVAAGRSFDEIEADLKKRCGFTKSPLTPRNVPYFRVTRADFVIPESADAILSMYGEDRGDGAGRQLYRLPIILPFDEVLRNLPHSMAAHSASTRRYWSEYTPSGHRVCLKYLPTPQNPMNRRAVRTFGGRKPTLNTEWQPQGLCEPEGCPIYQGRECAMTGKLYFWIPGIAGSSLFELPTGSFYSMSQMQSTMQMVLAARGGRITGMHNGQPLFCLTKVQDEVSRIDENGQPTRTTQFLVHLEATVNMGDILSPREALPAASTKAITVVEGEAATVSDAKPEPAKADEPTAGKRSFSPEVTAARRDLFSRVMALGINTEAFTTRCASEWGEGWGASLDALQAALDLLPESTDDMADFNRWLVTPF